MSLINNEVPENVPQKWYRSPVVQIAVISNVLFILKIFGVFEPFGITEDSYKEIITAITAIINVIAYANNPKDRNNW